MVRHITAALTRWALGTSQASASESLHSTSLHLNLTTTHREAGVNTCILWNGNPRLRGWDNRWTHTWVSPQPVLIHLSVGSRQRLHLEIWKLSSYWYEGFKPQRQLLSLQSSFSFSLHLLRGCLKQMRSSKREVCPHPSPWGISFGEIPLRTDSSGKGKLLQSVCSWVIYASLILKRTPVPQHGLVEQTMTPKRMKYGWTAWVHLHVGVFQY